MDQQLVIKLSAETKSPIGLVESPPVLYSNFKMLLRPNVFSDVATASEVEAHGYGVFEWAWEPTGLPHTLSVESKGLTKHADGIWRPTFAERNATAEEIAERTWLEETAVRADRDQLLLLSDYTQLPDCTLPRETILAFTAYRQELRNLPTQEGFPWNVNFPAPPN
jgi:hypothetical protein